MRKTTLLLAAAIFAAGSAAAHPMGNFSVNRYARLEPSREDLRLLYLVDFAEIPTFQEISALPGLAGERDPSALDASPDAGRLAATLARRWTAGLSARDAGVPLPFRIRSRSLKFAEGAAGLPTMKLSIVLEAPWKGPTASVRYDDANAPDRIGWREVVLRSGPGVVLRGADVDATDRSAALTRYPADPTADVPNAVAARFRAEGLAPREIRRVAPGSPPAIAAPTPVPSARVPAARANAVPNSPAAPPVRRDRFTELVAARRLTPALVLLSLAVAFALGGLHALSPGHGKTVVAAYLVGARGKARHALLLGAVVTASHTAGVFALGLVTLALSRAIVPEALYPAIQLFSGLAIVATGVGLFLRRLRTADPESHGHSHEIDLPAEAPTVPALIALGVSGGILPCPSALVVLLSAIALHRVGFGLLLIVAFSAGLASVLSGIGILVVRAGAALSRFRPSGTWMRRLPAFSALLIGILGAALAVRALPDLHRLFAR
jgi:ABC-type nickel/cobalt efflux system permease component RcnA